MTLEEYLAHQEKQPPSDHHRPLGIGILQGPREGRFRMSEVPLYGALSRCSGVVVGGERGCVGAALESVQGYLAPPQDPTVGL